MKTKSVSMRTLSIAIGLALLAAPVFAQGGNRPIRTDSKILYHDGPVMVGGSNIYLIWYGNWSGNIAQSVVTDFVVNLGSSPYFKINVDYPDVNGLRPNGVLIYSGTANDAYSRGAELSVADVQGIVSDQLSNGRLPLDGTGIYVVLGAADVSSNATGFCQLNTPPHHGMFIYQGSQIKYAFIGDPARCPRVAAPQLTYHGPTPNASFSGDGIANDLAAVMSAMVTNPTGSSWFDRYGLENSTKCQGSFGTTYTTPTGSQANVHLGSRDYLVQQNW